MRQAGKVVRNSADQGGNGPAEDRVRKSGAVGQACVEVDPIRVAANIFARSARASEWAEVTSLERRELPWRALRSDAAKRSYHRELIGLGKAQFTAPLVFQPAPTRA